MPRFEIKQFCSLVQKYQVSVCLLVPPVALLLVSAVAAALPNLPC